MAAFLWWRSWHGAPMDNKWPVIAARSGVKTGVVSAVAWALMDYASQHEPRGTVVGFDTEVYAIYSGFPETEIQAVMKAMEDKQIIVDGTLANWEKRQPKREDEGSTERVREWREKKRIETQCNAALGQEERESREDTDTEIDKDKEREESAPLDPFDTLQEYFLSQAIIPAGEKDVKAINKMVADGIEVIDLMNGLEWKLDHNEGKPVRYVSQLVGPAATAKAARLQSNRSKPQSASLPVFTGRE